MYYYTTVLQFKFFCSDGRFPLYPEIIYSSTSTVQYTETRQQSFPVLYSM